MAPDLRATKVQDYQDFPVQTALQVSRVRPVVKDPKADRENLVYQDLTVATVPLARVFPVPRENLGSLCQLLDLQVLPVNLEPRVLEFQARLVQREIEATLAHQGVMDHVEHPDTQGLLGPPAVPEDQDHPTSEKVVPQRLCTLVTVRRRTSLSAQMNTVLCGKATVFYILRTTVGLMFKTWVPLDPAWHSSVQCLSCSVVFATSVTTPVAPPRLTGCPPRELPQ